MTMPEFTAEASIYKTNGQYATGVSGQASGMHGAVRLAQSDSCNCGHLWGCAKNRCECECPDGYSGRCTNPCCHNCAYQ
jgi:hypothetical protein